MLQGRQGATIAAIYRITDKPAPRKGKPGRKAG
jgi:hypothetical protein